MGWWLVFETEREQPATQPEHKQNITQHVALYSSWHDKDFALLYPEKSLGSTTALGQLAAFAAGPQLFEGTQLKARGWEVTVNKEGGRDLPSPTYLTKNNRYSYLPYPPNVLRMRPQNHASGQATFLHYRAALVNLAAELAFECGEPQAVSTYFLLPRAYPKDLRGYQTWNRGHSVLATKKDEAVLLVKGNSVCPWITYRRIAVDDNIDTPGLLAGRILARDLYFNPSYQPLGE